MKTLTRMRTPAGSFRNDALKQEILSLVAQIEREDLERDARVVPRYWTLGKKLRAYTGPLADKYALAKGAPRYYRAVRIAKHFPSFADARAFDGSLRMLLATLKRPTGGRPISPAIEKAARALIRAANGDVRGATRYLIERHWKCAAALDWLQQAAAAEQKNNTEARQ